jgi:hypothetical protein
MMRPKKVIDVRLAADKAGAESTTITEEHLPLQQFVYCNYCRRILLGYEIPKLLTAEFVVKQILCFFTSLKSMSAG